MEGVVSDASSWILTSSAARGTYAVERFAGAHPPHCVGPLRSQGRGRPCLSIGSRPPGSLLHEHRYRQNGVNKGAFLPRLFHLIHLVAKGALFYTKFSTLPIPTETQSTPRKRQEAELRTRIAKHLSGRVRPLGASTLIADDLSHANFGQPGRPSMSDSADNQ